MDEDYLKFASKPFAGKWGGYCIGLYNGPGYTLAENNHNKVVSGLVYLRPLPSVPVLKGLQLAYAGSYGKSNSNFDPAKVPGASTAEFPDFQANVAQISLQDRLFTVMGQYYWGKATATSAEDFSRKAYQMDAFARIPGIEKLRVFGKYQYYDPNTDKDNDTSKKIVAGLSYDASKEFLPYVAYEKKTFDTNTTTDKDYNQYQVGFQLKF